MLSIDDFNKVDMRVGTIIEVVLGADTKEGCVILNPERKVENGSKIF